MLALISILLVGIGASIVAMHFVEQKSKQKKQQEIEKRMGVDTNDEMSFLEFVGSAIARYLPKRKKEHHIDRDLPELIDVLALGMEAGLSFESAFAIYANRFDTELACECRPTSALMTSGIMPREQAMEELAKRLGSNMFSRFVRITLRSVRFGSRLLPTLDGLSDEARKQYRSSIEEQASKAPTKMLVPTGVLILPAMLLLVCGPFLLELLEQF